MLPQRRKENSKKRKKAMNYNVTEISSFSSSFSAMTIDAAVSSLPLENAASLPSFYVARNKV